MHALAVSRKRRHYNWRHMLYPSPHGRSEYPRLSHRGAPGLPWYGPPSKGCCGVGAMGPATEPGHAPRTWGLEHTLQPLVISIRLLVLPVVRACEQGKGVVGHGARGMAMTAPVGSLSGMGGGGGRTL
jgi:hypothetical protein